MTRFNFINLDSETRELMCFEIQRDIEEEKLYKSENLNTKGAMMYEEFLFRAVYNGNEELFEKLLDVNTYFKPSSLQQRNSDKTPPNISKTLCQNEFNKYYIRAVCQKVIKLGFDSVVVYRAKPIDNPCPESEAKIGIFLTATELLADLRENTRSGLKILPEIDLGLSVKI